MPAERVVLSYEKRALGFSPPTRRGHAPLRRIDWAGRVNERTAGGSRRCHPLPISRQDRRPGQYR